MINAFWNIFFWLFTCSGTIGWLMIIIDRMDNKYYPKVNIHNLKEQWEYRGSTVFANPGEQLYGYWEIIFENNRYGGRAVTRTEAMELIDFQIETGLWNFGLPIPKDWRTTWKERLKNGTL
jgi:hypothetical protein